MVFAKKNNTLYVNCAKYEKNPLKDKKGYEDCLPIREDLVEAEKIREHFGVILPSKNVKIHVGNVPFPNEFWTKFKKSDIEFLY